MKLKNIFMLLVLAIGTFAFVACGDDDENTPQDPQDQGTVSEANKAVVGIYAGWTNLTTTYLNRNYANDTITIALSDGGSLVATFKDAIWGTATITGIQATDEDGDGQFELLYGEGSFVMNNPRDPEHPTQEFPCKLESAVVSPKSHQMKAVISAYMEVGHGNMTFTFQTGEMPTEE